MRIVGGTACMELDGTGLDGTGRDWSTRSRQSTRLDSVLVSRGTAIYDTQCRVLVLSAYLIGSHSFWLSPFYRQLSISIGDSVTFYSFRLQTSSFSFLFPLLPSSFIYLFFDSSFYNILYIVPFDLDLLTLIIMIKSKQNSFPIKR